MAAFTHSLSFVRATPAASSPPALVTSPQVKREQEDVEIVDVDDGMESFTAYLADAEKVVCRASAGGGRVGAFANFTNNAVLALFLLRGFWGRDLLPTTAVVLLFIITACGKCTAAAGVSWEAVRRRPGLCAGILDLFAHIFCYHYLYPLFIQHVPEECTP